MLKFLMHSFLRPLLRILFRLRIEGDTSQFHTPRLLIIANHESFLDGLLLGLFLPINPVFIVHTTIAKNFFFRLFLTQACRCAWAHSWSCS